MVVDSPLRGSWPLKTLPITVMKKYDDLDILIKTYDSKVTFAKHLRSVSRATSQRLGIFRKSCRVFCDI